MRYQLIVFDWDGTLMDSAGAIVRAIQGACRDLELPVPPDSRARHVIGLGLTDALQHAVPELTEARYPEMIEAYRQHYLSGDHELELFEGAAALIAQLRDAGYWLAVATGKSRLGLDRALQHCGLGPSFHATRCADECRSKPHPQMLEELMNEFGIDPSAALMIGDTSHDLLMAQNAGVDGVAVTYGAHTPEYLESFSPVTSVGSIGELAAWLQKHA